jgi:hypothetical protein
LPRARQGHPPSLRLRTFTRARPTCPR